MNNVIYARDLKVGDVYTYIDNDCPEPHLDRTVVQIIANNRFSVFSVRRGNSGRTRYFYPSANKRVILLGHNESVKTIRPYKEMIL